MRIDLHIHTSESSSGAPKPELLWQHVARTKLIERAREQGLDGICITEHDRMWSAEAIRGLREQYDFPVFSGMEVSTNYAEYGHVLVFGLESYVSGIWDSGKLARVCEEAGAAMIVAHPFREMLHPRYPSGSLLTIDEAAQWPIFQMVHGVEVFNGATLDRENQFAIDICQRLGLKGTGGSDAHSVVGLGSGVTIFERTLRDEQDLVAELRAGRFRAGSNGERDAYREWPSAQGQGAECL